MKSRLLLLNGLLLFLMRCSTSTGPAPTTGSIKGVVKIDLPSNKAAFAYLFIGDSLMAATDQLGNYSIPVLPEGSYSLICSASACHDTAEQVLIFAGQTTLHDFFLTPDSSTGRVYGEFHDTALFAQSLATHPGMINWSGKEIFEGVTGATIQSKTLQRQAPERRVFCGDSLLAVSDDFGQYWLEMPSGACLLKGACEGYGEAAKVVRVLPNDRVYVNFFLTPENIH
jgi:hypothetical protein